LRELMWVWYTTYSWIA